MHVPSLMKIIRSSEANDKEKAISGHSKFYSSFFLCSFSAFWNWLDDASERHKLETLADRHRGIVLNLGDRE